MKIRVVHFLNQLWGGGAEVMLGNLLEQADGEQVEHVVISLSSASEKPLAQRIARLAVRTHYLGESNFLGPRTLGKLWKTLRQEAPHVIQSWLHKPDLVGGWMGRLVGARPVWGIHSMDVLPHVARTHWQARAFRLALGFTSRWAPAAVVTCARAAQKSHQTWGYPQEKFHYIPNGIDTEKFRPDPAAGLELRAALGIPAGTPVVGFMGRLAPVKDIGTFARAAVALRKRMPNAQFIICGDASSPDQELAPWPEGVHRLGFRPDAEKVYPAFDLLALTSTSEAYPMVLIEAMSCGVPCVSTDVGDAAAMLEGRGKITPVWDAEAQAEAWWQMLTRSPEEAQALSLRLRVEAEENYSVARCCAAYHELYADLCG